MLGVTTRLTHGDVLEVARMNVVALESARPLLTRDRRCGDQLVDSDVMDLGCERIDETPPGPIVHLGDDVPFTIRNV